MDHSEKIKKLFAKELDISVEDVTPELGYNKIPEWDSVAHIHLMFALEENFNITLDDLEITDMTTIEKVTAAVERHLQ